MLNITDMLLTNSNRPKKKLVKLKGIVIHYTANTRSGANAVANRNYFNTTTNLVSAHYIVDDSNIIRCVPDDEVAYHVGAKKYTAVGEKLRMRGYTPNYFLIGIEMCVNSDGNWEKTYASAAELAASLLRKYNLTVNDLYRHYDITGKECPKMMLDEAVWNRFKGDVAKALTGVNIVVNAKSIGMDIILKADIIYVPAQQMAEALGARAEWDPQNRIMIINNDK